MKIKNSKFYPWFLGFFDAECSFISSLIPIKNKNNKITSYGISYRIQIGLHIKEKSLLNLINKKLGDIGKIYDYPLKQESTLCITTHDSLKYLIENIFQNILYWLVIKLIDMKNYE